MKLIKLSFLALAISISAASCDPSKPETTSPPTEAPPATPPPAPDSIVKPMDTTAKPADMTKTTGRAETKK